jgi:uncharacterized NAD-dependent epimerase/dehydratase family protein
MKDTAIVYVDRLFKCADGKTAHGLVRFSKRFDIRCVVDTTLQEGDSGEILDGIKRNIPLYNNLDKALKLTNADTFIIGAVSDAIAIPKGYSNAIKWALSNGLNIVSGLHEFISDNPIFMKLAQKNNCKIIDVRKIFRDKKKIYTGKINTVKSKRIAIIGTDSAVGKRTTAVVLNKDIKKHGWKSDMIYTGQTGWMQGWPHGVVIDAMINDFVAGGIEEAIIESWHDCKPDFMLIEGQGSLVHPFFPGGFEILAAGKIDGFIIVDAPGRKNLDGFPGYPMPNPERVIKIAELLTEKPLMGIGINSENLDKKNLLKVKNNFREKFRVPVVEPIHDGASDIVLYLEKMYEK